MSTASGWDGILQDGEVIVWQGQPTPGFQLRDLLTPTTAFGVVFTGFSTFWIMAASTMTANSGAPGIFVLFPLFGLPFLAVGLYMLAGHAVLEAIRRGKTWYTLTNRTAFIATEMFGRRSLERYPIADMPFIRLVEDRAGSVEFGDAPPVPGKTRRHGRRNRTHGATGNAPGFHHIAGARDVYVTLRRARFELTGDDLT